MSYINYKLLYQYELTNEDYHTLRKIAQREKELPLGNTNGLLDLDLITKDNKLTKKGVKILSEIETPQLTPDINIFLSKIIDKYSSLGYEDRIGNITKASKDLAWFYYTTGISFSGLNSLIDNYLLEQGNYCKYIENLFWKPISRYSTNRKLDESPLFSFFITKYSINPDIIKNKGNSKKIRWLSDINSLNPPKRLESHLTFTGSVEKDLERINHIRNEYKKIINGNNN